MYEKLKNQYQAGYITCDTLKTWVRINELRNGRGITIEEYREITGEEYS